MKNLPKFIHQHYDSWFDVAGIVTLAAVAAFAFAEYPADNPWRWVAVGIVLLFWLTLIRTFTQEERIEHEYVRLFILTTLAVLLFVIGSNPFAVVVLFFILSTQALSKLPPSIGYGWVVLFGLLTMIILSIVYRDIVVGGLNGLGALGGYFFMGSATYARRQAEAANLQSQRLLDELQVAHRKLQEQAVQAEALAVSEERNRLAREVHDTLGHRLTVAAVQLEGAQRLIQRDPEKAEEMVETVHTQVLEGLKELRHTVTTLRTPLEEQLSLPNALTRLVTNFEEATGVITTLKLPDIMPTLPDDHRHTLYRTAQESLTNIQRHAKAKHTTIFIDINKLTNNRNEQGDRAIRLTIQDDGIGIPDDAMSKGFGLQGLKERAEELHGHLTIQSIPGQNTSITIELPTKT